MSERKLYDVIIIGSGPAGHTCGLYLSRANLHSLMLEGDFDQEICPGGLLTTTKVVENFPGFPDGIDGCDLTDNFKKQSTRFGLTIISELATNITKENNIFTVHTSNSTYNSKAVVIATGSNPNKLNILGYDTFFHRGISTCAVCDAGLPCFRNVPIAVVGGGDSACEEALYISHTASKVYLIHRRDSLRASKVMQDRVFANTKIELIWDTEINEVKGEDFLEKLILKNNKTNEITELNVNGLFVAVGHTPNSEFVKDLIALDKGKYIVTDKFMRTNVEGIWACGDVQDPHWKQAITAASSGCICALDIEKWLN